MYPDHVPLVEHLDNLTNVRMTHKITGNNIGIEIILFRIISLSNIFRGYHIVRINVSHIVRGNLIPAIPYKRMHCTKIQGNQYRYKNNVSHTISVLNIIHGCHTLR